MQTLLRLILLPFSWIYGAIMALRNHLFDIGYTKSFRFQVPVLNVGNLSVGGNGKTPMVEYLIRLLANDSKVAVLSRGYGRKSRGFIQINDQHAPSTVGDEPWQMFLKFGTETTIAVGEERALAIPRILQEAPQTEVIILDDAFQHRTVNAHFNILVSDYNKPFYKDYILPAGRLREARKGANRAQAIIMTKCPPLDEAQQKHVIEAIRPYSSAPVWFSRIDYQAPLPVFHETYWPANPKVILVSGLANASSLKQYVQSKFNLIHHFDFPDHHRYTASDWLQIATLAQKNEGAVVLTTEKDVTKLHEISSSSQVLCYSLAIQFQFLANGSEFDNLVLNTLKKLEESQV